MVSAARRPPNTAHDIEATAEGLQQELARLEIQKQALERELSAVVAHLGSVQRILGTLQAVLPSQEAVPAAPAEEQPPQAHPAPVEESFPEAADGAPPADDEQRTYGKLTEQILEFFAGTGGADVRARDVAVALGRDSDNGSINAVRSTLDRLVGTSRIRRSGRGLYRAR